MLCFTRPVHSFFTCDTHTHLRFLEVDRFEYKEYEQFESKEPADHEEADEDRLLQAMQQYVTSGELIFGRIKDRFVSRYCFADARREYQRQKRSCTAASLPLGGHPV